MGSIDRSGLLSNTEFTLYVFRPALRWPMPGLFLLLSEREMRTMIAAIVIWIILLIAAVVFSFLHFPATSTDGLKDFFAAATIGCTAISAAMGCIVTVIAARRLETRKNELANKIEEKKNELATTLAKEIESIRVSNAKDLADHSQQLQGNIQSSIEAQKSQFAQQLADHTEKLRSEYAKELATFNQDLQKDLQLLKQSSERQLEAMKATTLSREIDAYQELLSSASQYYSTLSELEVRTVEPQEVKAADLLMARARSRLPYMESDAHRVLWERIWTNGRRIADSAKGLSRDREKQLWQNNVVEFGKLLREFEEVVAGKFPRP